MLEPRLYRAALLPALAAIVVLMFSVVARPDPLVPQAASGAFDQGRAAALAVQIAALAPERTPGGRGDEAIADLVSERFAQIEGGQLSEQRFDGEFEGDQVRLRNITLVLPGQSASAVAVIAPRDCAEGPCVASSAAATATLLELSATFAGVRHRKTLVLVSTDGASEGAAGARALAGGLRDLGVDGVVAVAHPAVESSGPFVSGWSSGPQSTSAQLYESARQAAAGEVGGATQSSEPGTFASLFRLALPSGLGEAAALVQEGVDAVAVSAAGELQPPPSHDDADSLSAQALGRVGRTTLALVGALDGAERPLKHGPEAYVPLAGKLVPGWSIALLALSLLLAPFAVSVDALARAARRGEPALKALAWILSRALPFAAVLVFAYLLALVGLMPAPDFPFDPGRYDVGVGPVITLLILACVAALSWLAVRTLRPPAIAHDALAPAHGLVAILAIVGIWVINPYLALLLVPIAHLWLLAGLPEPRRRRPVVAAIVALGLALPVLCLISLADRLDVGLWVGWDLLLMFTGGHFNVYAAALISVLGGSLVAAFGLADAARRPDGPPPSAISRAASRRMSERPGLTLHRS